MKCPYQNSLVPPCKIESHPQRDNVEYCKVCGEWRYLSEVGNDFPNVFWMLVSIAILSMLVVALLKQDPLFRNDQRQRGRDYMGQESLWDGAIVQSVELSNATAA